MDEKRVIEQVASNEVHNDDWFLKDSPTQDTSKISATNLKAILGADGTLALEEIANAIAEEYNPSATYHKNYYVFHEGTFYKCTQNNTTGTWDRSKWEATSVLNLISRDEGDITELKSKSDNSIAVNHSTIRTYNKGDYVFYWFHLYRCLEDDVYGEWDDSKWEEVNIPEYIDYVLENAGKVDDVKVDGTSVVTNKVAEIEIPVKDVEVDGTSVVNEQGVAEITLPDVPVQDVQVKTDSTYDSVVDENGNAKIDISGKANTSGYYEDFIAGTADNLMADNYTEDKVPYNFRQSFNGARLEDEIVGGTVAWNQIIPNAKIQLTENVSEDVASNKWGSTIAYVGNAFVDHVVVAICKLSNGKCSISWGANNYRFVDGGSGNTETTTTIGIYKPTQTMIGNSGEITFRLLSGLQAGTYNATINLIDLTQMFGSTIADYIYSLEQANEGAGIAWLKSYGFLTKDYYAYQSGKLESVNVASRKVVEFNQWDEEWEQGYYDANGNKNNVQNAIRSKNHIPCLPNTTYYIHNGTDSNGRIQFYDASKNWIGTSTGVMNNTVTTSNKCYYINISTGTTYGGTYNNDICINISDASKNGTYEPYTKRTYPLDSDLTLRGIPKLDANNNLYYDGDTYESDGSVTRRYGVVDLGQQTWYYKESGTSVAPYFYFDCTSLGIKYMGIFGTTTHSIRCVKYVAVERSTTNFVDKTMCADGGGNVVTQIQIKDSLFNGDTTAFKTAMNGVYLVYELATPTSETADAFINPQIVDARGTEEYVDYAESQGTRDVAIPVGHNSKYYADLKAKIEDIPDVPSTNGTYTLKATRSASGVTYSWVSD